MINLVAGGAGFLGSHLCRKLLDDKQTVICVDNFFTERKENVIDLIPNPYFEVIRHDINVPLYLEVDRIFNLACPASPKQYEKNPIETVKTSVYGTINLLELAQRSSARILQASTSEVYGDPLVSPQKEDYWGNVNPVGPRSCYDEGKRCAETLFNDFSRQNNIEIKIMRIFNTYGPNMDIGDGRVISNFIVQALRGEDLTVFGDGSQTRCFCYVDDLIVGMLNLMDTEKEIKGPVNIGNDEELTIINIAEKIIKATNSKSKIKRLDPVLDDPKEKKPNLELARQIINWEPKVDLDSGLNKTIKYFESII